MCKILVVVHLSLFIFTIIVECHNINNEPFVNETDVAKNRNQKQNFIIKDDATLTVTEDGLTPNTGTTEKSLSDENEQDEEENSINLNSTHTEEPNTTTVKEHSISRSGAQISSDRTDGYDYFDSSDDKENINLGDDDFKNDIETTSESGEVFIYNLNSKTLSQDAVLDLKARTGHDESEEIGFKTNLETSVENITKINRFPPRNMNMRSGYVSESNEEIRKPSEYRDVVSDYNRPNFAYKDPKPDFNRPITTRPEMTHNYYLQNSPLHPPPRFFNSLNSRELFYSNSNNREIMSGPSNDIGQQTMKSHYFDLPNTQLFNSRIYDKCSKCFQGRVSSPARTFRSVVESTFRTADGRTIEFEPEDGNSYPFIPIQHSEEVQRVNNAPSLFSATSRVSNSGERIPSPNHYLQTSDHQTHPGSIPKFLLSLPSYTSNNPILLNRRTRLGGIQRFILSK